MPHVITFTQSSRLAAPATQVWARAVTWAGVNAELWPVRMTAPPEWRDRDIGSVPCGQPLFQSWILLLGVLPLDVHHFRLESVGPGFRFQEDSSSLVNRQWRHQRIVEPESDGCVLTDRLEIAPRFALLGFLLAPVYRLVFASRHRKLRRWHGTREG
jgi:ligand-binding SRPBCC domain-containing protein